MNARRWRFLAPEVVQTSGMDCGPAALSALARGLGLRASYGRLREACHTDVDGTSIDALEDVARRLGLDAEQVMMPGDHLLLREADALPAIAVVRLDESLLHFVVVWRRVGPWIQLMDPARGRRWVRRERFLEDLYLHEQHVPRAVWSGFARGDGFERPFVRRLRALGLSDRAALDAVHAAGADEDGRALAALDAAQRSCARLCASGALRRGREAGRALLALASGARASERALPRSTWSALDAEPDPETGEARVLLRGAVLLRARGRLAESAQSETSAALRAARSEPEARPWRALWRLASEGSAFAFPCLLAASALAGAGLVAEGLLARAWISAVDDLRLGWQRFGAVIAFAAFVIALLFVELGAATGLARLGRRLELRIRARVQERVPRIADEYFASRPVSDLAERAHSLHQLRGFPETVAAGVRALAGLACTAFAMAWIEPSSAPIALGAALASLAVPLAFGPRLAEAELRARTQAGALGRFYLDALLGLTALRAHAAERVVRREHEGLCATWLRASLDLLASALRLEGLQVALGLGAAIVLVLRSAGEGGDPTRALLVAFWALALPVFGQELALVARRAAASKSLVLRILEPLGAPEDVAETLEAEQDVRAVRARSPRGVALVLEDVSVVAGGHALLRDLSLTIEAGEEIAVVGPSGAGKSSLAGLFLGWRQPASGRVLVDGEPLDARVLERLRRETVWVDPAVRLWNRSLLENLAFGLEPSAPLDLPQLMEAARLGAVVERLPEGMRTPLGEGGGLLSGGEGQRVRFGRGLARTGARLVVLDEAFRGLDREARRALLGEARRAFRGATLLWITHDVRATRELPRVLVMEHGRIVEDGAPAQLLEREDSLYARLLAAEDEVARALFANAAWRRLRLVDGRLVEEACA